MNLLRFLVQLVFVELSSFVGSHTGVARLGQGPNARSIPWCLPSHTPLPTPTRITGGFRDGRQ